MMTMLPRSTRALVAGPLALSTLLLLGCEDQRQGYAEGRGPPAIATSASAKVVSVGDPTCDAYLERLEACSPRGPRPFQMRERMELALAEPSTRAEAIAVCVKAFEYLRRACPKPGDPPIPESSSVAPSASVSVSAGPEPTASNAPAPGASGSATPR
jgi:hypothetical protein